MVSRGEMEGRLGGRPPERIAIFRALMLGDLLCAIPACRAVRRAYPAAEISLIGLPWAHQFVELFPEYFDRLIEFPGFPGLPEREPDIHRFPGFLAEVQQCRFDLALQFHGSGVVVNRLMPLMGARVTAGMHLAHEYCPDEQTYVLYPESEPEVRRPLRLLEHLGIPLCGEELEFPVREQDRREWERMAGKDLPERPYIVVHPGARLWSRRWKPERFAQVGDELARSGYEIVITGAASETELSELVSRSMTAPHVNLAGRTSLGLLAALLDGCRLLISNDTGISHVAAALRVPSVVIVTGSSPSRWAPLDGQRHHVVMRPVDCRPCLHFACPIGFPCAEQITVEEVVHSAWGVLERFGGERVPERRQAALAAAGSP